MKLDIIFRKYKSHIEQETVLSCLNALKISIEKAKNAEPSLDCRLHVLDCESESGGSLKVSVLYAQEHARDLVYFVNQDCFHNEIAIYELYKTFLIFNSKINNGVILTPFDHPFRNKFEKGNAGEILLGHGRHWAKTIYLPNNFLIEKKNLSELYTSKSNFTTYVTYFSSVEEIIPNQFELSLLILFPIPSLASCEQHTNYKSNYQDRLELVTVASQDARGFRNLVESARRRNIEVSVLGWHQEFSGMFWKIKALNRWLKTAATSKHILFLDAYDTVMLDEASTILERFKKKNVRLLVSAEKNCFPDKVVEKFYPQRKSPYRFLNSGAYIGETEFLKELLGKYNIESIMNQEDDQRVFTDLYLKHQDDIEIDSECEIFQSLGGAEEDVVFENDRIQNKVTGSSPSILHFNGKIKQDQILSWLNFPPPLA